MAFLQIRDGSGFIQGVLSKADASSEEDFQAIRKLSQESSIICTGTIVADERSLLGYELQLKEVELVATGEGYPITPKAHGTDFLMDHRHLWLRSKKQFAILRIRSRIMRAMMNWLDDHGFLRMDTPILTPNACEGTTTLFETDYFDEKAFLSQSGQLYNEANAAAFGKVYCFGPTFRAEKSKTRRHLMEFWMCEPEIAYCDYKQNMDIQEQFVTYIAEQVLEHCSIELDILQRDKAKLELIKAPFPRVTYDDAVKILKDSGEEFTWGQDFGGGHETIISEHFGKPVFVTHFPAKIKAFYMQPDPERPEVVLGSDLLAPEGYGEVIGGGERIWDKALLEQRMKEHGLDEDYDWYLDLRRFGSVPHAGFGIGLERTVAWMCGREHIRETIPFPRMLSRLRP